MLGDRVDRGAGGSRLAPIARLTAAHSGRVGWPLDWRVRQVVGRVDFPNLVDERRRVARFAGPHLIRHTNREVNMIGILMKMGGPREIARLLTSRMNVSDRGATAVEYGMIVALIAGVIVLVVGLVGADVLFGFNLVEDQINGDNG